MKKGKVSLIFVLAILFIFPSCYPENEIFLEETDTVYTTHLPGTDFNSMKYFILNDSVLRMDTADYFGNSQYDNLIFTRFKENMMKRGFEQVSEQNANQVDFVVYISDVSYLDITYYWARLPYGYLYPNLSEQESNAFYPLPPPTNIMVGARASYMIDILDYNDQDVSDTTYVLWRGLTHGVQSSSMNSRIANNIDQMFYQSPNLKSLK